MEYRIGFYEFEGNTVEYDGDVALDLDSNEELPEDILEHCTYLGETLDND